MALSDRVALLRSGHLEQIATPREIYGRPATAYAAQFIGQTNLLRATVRDGIATCGPLAFRTDAPDGPASFSLRQEAIRLAPAGGATSAAPGAITARFPARIVSQHFGGATDALEIDCATGAASQALRARVAAPGPLTVGSEQIFEFHSADATRVSDKQQPG